MWKLDGRYEWNHEQQNQTNKINLKKPRNMTYFQLFTTLYLVFNFCLYNNDSNEKKTNYNNDST